MEGIRSDQAMPKTCAPGTLVCRSQRAKHGVHFIHGHRSIYCNGEHHSKLQCAHYGEMVQHAVRV